MVNTTGVLPEPAGTGLYSPAGGVMTGAATCSARLGGAERKSSAQRPTVHMDKTERGGNGEDLGVDFMAGNLDLWGFC